MSAEQVQVQADRLRASRQLQLEQANRASEIACQVRTAATAGNAFGKIGQIAGLETSYLTWVDGEATALEELTRMLTDLADALSFTADDYDGADRSAADRVTNAYGRPS